MSDTYIVKKGDCLWNIAKANGMTLGELLAANPQFTKKNGRDPNLIFPGEKVIIPNKNKFSKDNDLKKGKSKCSQKVQKCTQPTITKKSGGITGLTLDVTYEVKDSKCDSLQIIQVFWGTRRSDGIKVGNMEVKANGKKYDAFVDGGKASPFVTMSGNPPAHPTKPYYLTPSEVNNQVNYSGGKGTIRMYDRPGAVVVHDEAYFETAIICVNHNKSGKDKVLKAFKWGWVKKGKTYQTSPGSGKQSSGLEEYDDVSSEFKAVLKNDYPNYSLD